jgi:tetratricopeptide (TPR) repeat protein
MMETAEKQTAKAIGYYKNAVGKHPTPQSYINLANLYRDNNAYFESMFKLQEAVVEFPDNGPINNNLAQLFSKTDIVDSTLYYLSAVGGNKRAERAAKVNLLSLYAKKGVVGNLDSLIGAFNIEDADMALQANLLAFGNLKGKKIEGVLPPERSTDSLLNLHEFAYLTNGSVSGINQWEIAEADFNSWQNNPYNGAYNEGVGFAGAWSSYKAGKIESAFRQLDFLGSNISVKQGYYRHIAGMLALEQRAYYLAVENFEAASNLYVSDHENMALANLELGQVAAAMPHVNLIADQTKREMLVTAALLSTVEIPETNDQVRYLALRFRYRDLSETEINAIFETFDEILYREYAALMLVRKYLDAGNVPMAEKIMAKIPFGSEQKTENERELLIDGIRQANGQPVELTLEDLKLMGISDETVINYYTAKTYDSQNDTANATIAFRELGKRNPFEVESILAAAAYFNKVGDIDEAYSILQEALAVNKYSVPLIKGYIDQAIKMNLPQYADAMVIKLIDLLPSSNYATYEVEVEEKLRELENRQAEWNFND